MTKLHQPVTPSAKQLLIAAARDLLSKVPSITIKAAISKWNACVNNCGLDFLVYHIPVEYRRKAHLIQDLNRMIEQLEAPVITYREKLLSLIDAAKYENATAEKAELKSLATLITCLWLAARPVKTKEDSVYTPGIRPVEYPLYTAECAKDCPTSRYVGGVSRSLCECSQPEKCLGVRRIKLLFRGIRVTRREYMNKDVPTASGSLSGKDKHNEYWSQFVSLCIINNVAKHVGIGWIAKSTDTHFNDIPLRIWESLGVDGKTASYLTMAESFTYANGVYNRKPSLSDIVCINKQAASILRDILNNEYRGSK